MNDLPALFLRIALAAGLFLHGGPVATAAAVLLLPGYQLRVVAIAGTVAAAAVLASEPLDLSTGGNALSLARHLAAAAGFLSLSLLGAGSASIDGWLAERRRIRIEQRCATTVAPAVRNRDLAIEDCTCAGLHQAPAWRRWLASAPE